MMEDLIIAKKTVSDIVENSKQRGDVSWHKLRDRVIVSTLICIPLLIMVAGHG